MLFLKIFLISILVLNSKLYYIIVYNNFQRLRPKILVINNVGVVLTRKVKYFKYFELNFTDF